MSFLDYGSRLQGSLGKFGKDIDSYKNAVMTDKFAGIEKLFSPEISQTASQLTNLQDIKNTVDTTLNTLGSGFEAVGAAAGVKKLYGAIKDKINGKSSGDQDTDGKTASEGMDEENQMIKPEDDPFNIEGTEMPDWLKPAFEDNSSTAQDLFGSFKSGIGDISSRLQALKEGRFTSTDTGPGSGGGGATPSSGAGQEIELADMSDPTDNLSTTGDVGENLYTSDQIPTDYPIQGDTTGGLLKPTGATRPVPEGMTHTAPKDVNNEEIGDANDIESGLTKTEEAIQTGTEISEGVEETTSALSGFLDAVPIIGSIIGIGLQVGSAVYEGVEMGQEGQLEKQEATEEQEEKATESDARTKIQQSNNLFTGSTVVPTFSSMASMAGSSGIF